MNYVPVVVEQSSRGERSYGHIFPSFEGQNRFRNGRN